MDEGCGALVSAACFPPIVRCHFVRSLPVFWRWFASHHFINSKFDCHNLTTASADHMFGMAATADSRANWSEQSAMYSSPISAADGPSRVTVTRSCFSVFFGPSSGPLTFEFFIYTLTCQRRQTVLELLSFVTFEVTFLGCMAV